MIRNHRNQRVTPRQRAKGLVCSLLERFADGWEQAQEPETGAPVVEGLTVREINEIDRQIRRLCEAFGRRNAWPMFVPQEDEDEGERQLWIFEPVGPELSADPHQLEKPEFELAAARLFLGPHWGPS